MDKISKMTEEQLKNTWQSLAGYNPHEKRDDLPMDEFAELIYSEMTIRNFSTNVKI